MNREQITELLRGKTILGSIAENHPDRRNLDAVRVITTGGTVVLGDDINVVELEAAIAGLGFAEQDVFDLPD